VAGAARLQAQLRASIGERNRKEREGREDSETEISGSFSPSRAPWLDQSQVCVCASQEQEAQSPSLKQGSPAPNEPGVHGGAPEELELPLLVELPQAQALVEPMLFTHSAWQAPFRQAAVAVEMASAGPQTSGEVQAVTVFPTYRHPTRQTQLASAAHAPYSEQHAAFAQAMQASSLVVVSQEVPSCVSNSGSSDKMDLPSLYQHFLGGAVNPFDAQCWIAFISRRRPWWRRGASGRTPVSFRTSRSRPRSAAGRPSRSKLSRAGCN
jgi:hypothetical protein